MYMLANATLGWHLKLASQGRHAKGSPLYTEALPYMCHSFSEHIEGKNAVNPEAHLYTTMQENLIQHASQAGSHHYTMEPCPMRLVNPIRITRTEGRISSLYNGALPNALGRPHISVTQFS